MKGKQDLKPEPLVAMGDDGRGARGISLKTIYSVDSRHLKS